MRTRYEASEHGYRIVGSKEQFNRVLFGGHGRDSTSERYFTLAGDSPIVLGAVTDWRKREDSLHAKCGVFMAGIALSPGLQMPIHAGMEGGDRTAEWFHQSDGTVSTFRNGWMEHEAAPFFQCAAVVKAFIEVLPLQTEDGFLVHLRVSSDVRVRLVMAFGGITGFLGYFESPLQEARNLHPDHCRGNTIAVGLNRALVSGAAGGQVQTAMWIGASFPVRVTVGDANRIDRPGLFLGETGERIDAPMARMESPIHAGATLDGFIVVMRNAEEKSLEGWLGRRDPVAEVKQEIIAKRSALEMRTPDPMLDLTMAPNVLSMDAAWHGNTFFHGAYTWHFPYMGWRNWYGPTAIGWHDRVQTAFRIHASHQVGASGSPWLEQVSYDGPDQHSQIRNSYGYIPEIPDGRTGMYYTMQEVGVDMILHNIEWTGNLAYGRKHFDSIAAVLDWEERILDPDHDGLYQNWLNTWISDAHSYNGGGCAQSSAYNFRANLAMARLATLLDKDPRPFATRAEKIRKACQERLWLPARGVLAEYIDTVGKRLIHPSPELATIYLAIDAGVVDPYQAYQMLRFTETSIRNERTIARSGRLAWSSDWYPQIYSSCGLYPAENIHLALAYFQCGQVEKGFDILTGIVDGHFLGRYPGLVCHCATVSGYTDGAADFTDITSMYLRLIVEGLFGIRCRLLDDRIEISPGFPRDWDHASLSTREFRIRYRRHGKEESLAVECGLSAKRIIRLPLRSTTVRSVSLNGNPAAYRIEPGIGCSFLVVQVEPMDETVVDIVHGDEPLPSLQHPGEAYRGDRVVIAVNSGTIIETRDPSAFISEVACDGTTLRATGGGEPGPHTVFLRIQQGMGDGWLPADITIKDRVAPRKGKTKGAVTYESVDISSAFNCSLSEIHTLKYEKPRPKGYSIMTMLNGRFGWDWNQAGFNVVRVDDSALRRCGGVYTVPSGTPFLTPSAGKNVACISIWDNFPEHLVLPLSGKGQELAVFFIGVTNPMQSRVENGRFEVEYRDGEKVEVSLVNPENFDDWLVAAVQRDNETAYFSDWNHGIVQRIQLDPAKELKSFGARAVANEVIIGILGISILRLRQVHGH